ncbi:MAG: protein kinase [Catenulisporales bacterium]|nr:protein kinase [Catenulisporales bacterium]
MEALKPEDPARIGPFTPLARIGAGGMGRVYLARSRGGRPVAVKVIRAEYAEDERFRNRFRREVEAARTVNGLYTASVLDAGPDDAAPWLATAYIPGPSLQRVVHDHGPLPEHSARVLGAGIAEALGAIHGAGLIHRDLKPSNVICGPDGPRVIDFGISHAVGGTSLTATGVVVGSTRYASPEQCRADPEMLPASDVFALGGVLVFATTGVPPFGEGPDHVQLYLVVHEKPDLIGVPGGLRPIVAACLEKEPGNRPSIDELLDTLLPPGAVGAVDWLPEAVHRDLHDYAAAPSTGPTEIPTHARPEPDPAPTPVPGEPAGQGSNPTRRRMLTGVAGLAAMAATGGGAWFAATRHTKKNEALNGGTTSPTTTPGTQNVSAGGSLSPTPGGAPSSPASPTPTPTVRPTGKFGENWSSSTDLGGGAGGALVRDGKLLGVYTATSDNPSQQQVLVALNTGNGESAWPPQNVPAVASVGGAGIAVDDQHIYTYGAGTVYAWNLSDGQKAWSKSSGLPAAQPDSSAPLTGVLGLIGSTLIIGAPAIDPSNPPSLAGFDVSTRTTAWIRKPAELLTYLPSDVPQSTASIAVTVPRAGSLFYLALSDPVSMRVLKAMNPQTGKDVWHTGFTRRTQNEASGTPTVTGTAGHVYLTDMHSGSIHAYDSSGTWKWTHPDPDAPDHVTMADEQRYTGPVAEADGVVYATNARSVIALDALAKSPSGATVWQQSKQFNGLRGAPVVVGDKIWVEVHTPTGATPLALAVLNRSDGQPVRQYPMPEGPTASSADLLVADPDSPAVYVLTAGGQVLGYRRAE